MDDMHSHEVNTMGLREALYGAELCFSHNTIALVVVALGAVYCFSLWVYARKPKFPPTPQHLLNLNSAQQKAEVTDCTDSGTVTSTSKGARNRCPYGGGGHNSSSDPSSTASNSTNRDDPTDDDDSNDPYSVYADELTGIGSSNSVTTQSVSNTSGGGTGAGAGAGAPSVACPPRSHNQSDSQHMTSMFKVITKVQTDMVSGVPPYRIFETMLDYFLRTMDSAYGFIGQCLFEHGKPYLRVIAIAHIMGDGATQRFHDKNFSSGIEFHNLESLYGLVLVNRIPIISNNPKEDSRRDGKSRCPYGHPPLQSFFGIPFFFEKQLVGMVGIANRHGGFTMDMLPPIEPLLVVCANAIHSTRLDIERREALENKKMFWANLAHELRTPLQGIIGIAELSLHDRTIPTSSAKVPTEVDADGMQLVLESGKMLLSIVNSVIDYSKLDAAEINVVAADTNLLDLMDSTVSVVSMNSCMKRVLVSQSVGHDFPVSVNIDPCLVQRVMVNLVSNSVKFTFNGDVVVHLDGRPMMKSAATSKCGPDSTQSVSTASTDSGAISDTKFSSSENQYQLDTGIKCLQGGCVRTASGTRALEPGEQLYLYQITVHDSGVGIIDADIPKLFEAFTQVDESNSRKFGGTGLGLATCRRIADLVGGMISATSTPGQGSSFCFQFPVIVDSHQLEHVRSLGSPAKFPIPAPVPAPAPIHHVVLVETNSYIISSLRWMMRRAGIVLTVFSNEIDAMTRVNSEPDIDSCIAPTCVLFGLGSLMYCTPDAVDEYGMVQQSSTSSTDQAVPPEHAACEESNNIGTPKDATDVLAVPAIETAESATNVMGEAASRLQLLERISKRVPIGLISWKALTPSDDYHRSKHLVCTTLCVPLCFSAVIRALQPLCSGDAESPRVPPSGQPNHIGSSHTLQCPASPLSNRVKCTPLQQNTDDTVTAVQRVQQNLKSQRRLRQPFMALARLSLPRGIDSQASGTIVPDENVHSLHRYEPECIASFAAEVPSPSKAKLFQRSPASALSPTESSGSENTHKTVVSSIDDAAVAPELTRIAAVNVLIVDDNRVNQKVMRRQFIALGVSARNVAIAHNGEHGVAVFRDAMESKHHDAGLFDIIIMDLQMPIMDGYESAMTIRALQSNDMTEMSQKLSPSAIFAPHRPWIVGTSASLCNTNIQRCKEAGMNDTLQKPVMLQPLREVILRAGFELDS